MSGKNKSGGSTWVDPDDAPELTDEFFEQATVREGTRIIRRGRPKAESPKVQITLRLDAGVVDELRATGPGWQTRANTILKRSLASRHRRAG
jgi:uncharacterized protein (DUF4415 family)